MVRETRAPGCAAARQTGAWHVKNTRLSRRRLVTRCPHPWDRKAPDAVAADRPFRARTEFEDIDGDTHRAGHPGPGGAAPGQGAGDRLLADHDRPQEDRSPVPDHLVRLLL